MPQSARMTEGGGVQSLFGQCPFEPGDIFGGASLIIIILDILMIILMMRGPLGAAKCAIALLPPYTSALPGLELVMSLF